MRKLNTDHSKSVGGLTTCGADELAFVKSSWENDPAYPDFEKGFFVQHSNQSKYIHRLFNWDSAVQKALRGMGNATEAFQIFEFNLHQKSSKTIRLNSSPFNYLLIDANYLTDLENHDDDFLYKVTTFSLNLTKTKTFKKINTQWELVLCNVHQQKELL